MSFFEWLTNFNNNVNSSINMQNDLNSVKDTPNHFEINSQIKGVLITDNIIYMNETSHRAIRIAMSLCSESYNPFIVISKNTIWCDKNDRSNDYGLINTQFAGNCIIEGNVFNGTNSLAIYLQGNGYTPYAENVVVKDNIMQISNNECGIKIDDMYKNTLVINNLFNGLSVPIIDNGTQTIIK